MDLTLFDYIVLIIITISAIWGLIRGFVSQAISIVALIVGVWCAFKFSELISEWVKEFFSIESDQSVVNVCVFIAILIVVIIVGHFISKGLEKIIKISMMDWLNKLLGFVFSALKATMILSIVAYAIANTLVKDWEIMQPIIKTDSYLFLLDFANVVFPYFKTLIS